MAKNGEPINGKVKLVKNGYVNKGDYGIIHKGNEGEQNHSKRN